MNHLEEYSELKNRYFALRHGQSEANIQGIIASNPDIAINRFGLTELGKSQIEQSILKSEFLDNRTVIYSSPFKRAKESAEIVRKLLRVSTVNFSNDLRERFFGDLDQTENTNYYKVLEDDKLNPAHNLYNVESVYEVLDRVTRFIVKLEEKYEKQKILLVSHGDPLQILETGFKKMSLPDHRSLKHLEVAQIRELKLV